MDETKTIKIRCAVTDDAKPRQPLKVLFTSDTHRGYSEKTSSIHQKWARELELLDFDIVLLCGDLATNRKHQFRSALEFYRRLAGGRPVLLVRGNHDLQEATFNHHFSEWRVRQASLRSLLQQHQEWFEELQIHHLEDKPVHLGGVLFLGWDGWYHRTLGDINRIVLGHNDLIKAGGSFSTADRASAARLWGIPSDSDRLPPVTDGISTFEWLRQRAEEEYQSVLAAAQRSRLEASDRKIVVATHFPPFVDQEADVSSNGNPSHLLRLSGLADVLCYGHSHIGRDEPRYGIRVMNAGSDYDKPAFRLFEI